MFKHYINIKAIATKNKKDVVKENNNKH